MKNPELKDFIKETIMQISDDTVTVSLSKPHL